MSQSQPLRIECADHASFGTCRTINSRLWFVNSPRLEERILGYLAKYVEKFEVKLYSFVFSGSHFHPLTQFPRCNRAAFYRDLNARAAEGVRRLVPNFPGGPLFERRYSEQAVLTPADIEKQFFYCALQPVASGLCERISEYPGYNSFYDAISGKTREFKVIDWAGLNAARRHNVSLPMKDFVTTYTLRYDRLPGYEHLSQHDYKTLMLKKLEEKRVELVARMKKDGHKFMTREALLRVVPGTPAKNPKKSDRFSFRPLVICHCAETRKAFLAWYFGIYQAYKEAVKAYLAGNVNVEFPPGTYRPPSLVPVV